MVFLVASYYNTSSIGDIADRLGFDISMGCMSLSKLEQSEQAGLVEYFAVDSMDTDSDTGFDIGIDIGFDIGLGKNFFLGLNSGSGIDDIDFDLSKDTGYLY